MKLLLPALLSALSLIVATANVSAQSFTNLPNDTINIIGSMEDLETLTIQQLNISNKSIVLKWRKVSESVPVAWEASVCDNVTCNTTLVDSGTMNAINNTETGFILLHLTPRINFGKAIVRYAVWDAAIPLKKDTLTFILTLNANSSIVKAENKIKLSLFPNPANESFNINLLNISKFQFTVADVTGKVTENGNSATELISINTKNWQNGLYFVSIITENEGKITKQLIIQH